MDKELGRVFQRCCPTEEQDHSRVSREELNNTSELDVGGRSEVELLSANRGVKFQNSSNYVIPPL